MEGVQGSAPDHCTAPCRPGLALRGGEPHPAAALLLIVYESTCWDPGPAWLSRDGSSAGLGVVLASLLGQGGDLPWPHRALSSKDDIIPEQETKAKGIWVPALQRRMTALWQPEQWARTGTSIFRAPSISNNVWFSNPRVGKKATFLHKKGRQWSGQSPAPKIVTASVSSL